MKEVLDSLSRTPGIRVVMLTSADGMPIVTRGRFPSEDEVNGTPAWGDSAEDLNVLAALSIGWQAEIARAVGPLTWDAPRRVVLKAARGTIVLVAGPGAVLLALLQRGMDAEELRLPMEGALSRIQRILRGMGRGGSALADECADPPGLHPGGIGTTRSRGAIPLDSGRIETTGKGVPGISG